MVLVRNEGGEDIGSFVIQLDFLYKKKDFQAFERQVAAKIRELMADKSENSLMKLYWYLDPIYRLLYFDIKTKSTPISIKLQKMIEMASMPLYQMSEEVRANYLSKLTQMLTSHKF